jgi:hypothetical protein
MPVYATDHSTNVTVVDGTAPVGWQAANGSLNVFQVDGSVWVGAYHASGARNVILTASDQEIMAHPSGAVYVSVSPYKLGTMKVTVTGGAFV